MIISVFRLLVSASFTPRKLTSNERNEIRVDSRCLMLLDVDLSMFFIKLFFSFRKSNEISKQLSGCARIYRGI